MLEEYKNKEWVNCGEIKEEIDKLEDFPEKYEKELHYLFAKYNEFVNFVAYKMNKNV